MKAIRNRYLTWCATGIGVWCQKKFALQLKLIFLCMLGCLAKAVCTAEPSCTITNLHV